MENRDVDLRMHEIAANQFNGIDVKLVLEFDSPSRAGEGWGAVTRWPHRFFALIPALSLDQGEVEQARKS